MLQADGEVIDAYISKLNSLGYISMPEYDVTKYKYSGEEIYNVGDDFPRITRDSLRTEIANVNYLLSIPSISTWKK